MTIGLILAVLLLRSHGDERAPQTTRIERAPEPDAPLPEAYESGVEDLVEIV